MDIGDGRDEPVPINAAVEYLTADLVRLGRMHQFAQEFMAHATSSGAEVQGTFFLLSDSDFRLTINNVLSAFQVSKAFIIKFYGPAAATNATVSVVDGAVVITQEVHSVYLVEPRRISSAVLKFSGTLGMSTRIDKRSATLMAFSHYVMGSTACRYMFADIQGIHPLSLLCVIDCRLTNLRLSGS